jgi:hypothetical protein
MLFLSVTEIDGRRALDSVSTMARVAALVLVASAAVTCAFCADSDARMAAASSRRVVTCEPADGGRAFPGPPKMAVELGLFLRRAGRSVMAAARVIVTEVSQVASG